MSFLRPGRVEGHTIRWFVVAGGEKIPHEASMRGTWGWEAECECGWKSRTGGAVRSWVEDLVREHKREAMR